MRIEDQTKPKQKHNSSAPPAIAARDYGQNRHVQYIMRFPIPYQVVLIKCMNCKDPVLTFYPLECFKVKKIRQETFEKLNINFKWSIGN